MTHEHRWAARVVGGLVLTLLTAAPAVAAWTSLGSGSAAVAATVLPAPTAVTATAVGTSVTVSWIAPSLPGGAVPGGYVVSRASHPGGVVTSVGDTCVGVVGTTSCTETVAPGEWTYSVSARLQDWSSAASQPSSALSVVQPLSPGGTLSFPVHGGVYRAAAWDAGCAGTPGMCGTATPASGFQPISSVTVSLRSPDGTYWDGSAFTDTTPVGVVAYEDPAAEKADPVEWAYAFGAAGFPLDGSYSVTVTVTDQLGLSQTADATFLVDRTAPASAVTAPAGGTVVGSGTQVTVTASATDAGSGVASVTFERRATTGTWETIGAPLTAAPFATTTSFAAGTYELRTTVVDGAGNVGTSPSSGLTVRPTVTALSTVALAQDGKLRIGERLTVTFSDPMAPSTFCSTWSGTGDHSLVASSAVRLDLSAADVLTVTITSPSVCGGTFNLGPITLGANYNSHNANVRTFTGTKAGEYSEILWDAAGRRLTLVFGKASGGTEGTVSTSTHTASIQPSGVPTSTNGVGLQTTSFSTSVQRF